MLAYCQLSVASNTEKRRGRFGAIFQYTKSRMGAPFCFLHLLFYFDEIPLFTEDLFKSRCVIQADISAVALDDQTKDGFRA